VDLYHIKCHHTLLISIATVSILRNILYHFVVHLLVVYISNNVILFGT